MSIYDYRDRPAYDGPPPHPRAAENPHILRWWTPEHDRLLVALIEERRWLWYWSASDVIVANTPAAVLDEWRRSDPWCQSGAWYNVLMNFALARANATGLSELVRRGATRRCLLCGESFLEESLPVPLAERLGIDRLEFCAPCLRDTVLQGTGDPGLSREAVVQHIRELAAVVRRVPKQGLGERIGDFSPFSTEERVRLLQVLRGKPTVARVKELFVSWRNAVAAAGVVDHGKTGGARGRPTRG